MSTLKNISVTILTKNSQKYIDKCLNSLKEFDEVIVLDNGSTDNTMKIAKTYKNVNLKEHQFIGFGKMKRLAAQYAKHSWILNIDSDEVVSEELVEEIKKENLHDKKVYRFRRKNFYNEKLINGAGWERDTILRLYNKKETDFTDRAVHEKIISEGFKITTFKNYIFHYSYNSISELLAKMDKYTSYFAQEYRFRKKTSPLIAYTKKTFHFWNYFLVKKGFLFGYEGFIISMCNANGSFYKYMKLYEENKRLDISLIVTTYNRPDALELVLLSIKNQKILPKEVIIADDGSSYETKNLIEKYKQNFPIPLIHSWQEDNGFRAAQSRNKAIAFSKYEYIVIIDGDIVLHKNFIKDHIRTAQKKCFVQGSRVLLNEELTKESITRKNVNFSILKKGVENKLNAISFSFLRQKLSKPSYKSRGIRSCNMAFWKEDCVKINGFNEEFVGWGREDSEFAIRLFNNNIKRKNLKFAGIAYHLFHDENNRKMLPKNDEILEKTIENKLLKCNLGIDQYL